MSATKELNYRDALNRELKTETMFRVANVDSEARTAELSFSSDAPIEHWFGNLILDHEERSVRLDRLRRTGALLWNHNPDEQIGAIENVRLERGKLRATVRFSDSECGEENFRDVANGIKRNTSIGFRVFDIEPELDAKGNQISIGEIPVFRSRDWEPFEGSLVSIPADVSTGVNRSMTEEKDPPVETPDTDDENTEKEQRALQLPVEEQRTMADEKAESTVEVVTSEASAENTRVQQYTEFVRSVAQDATLEHEAKRLALQGKPFEEVRALALKHLERTQPEVSTGETNMLSEKEKDQYSLARGLRAFEAGEKTLETELSDALSAKVDGYRGGFVLPTNQRITRAAAHDTATATKGPEVVFVEPGSFLDLFRNKTKVLQLGASLFPGLQGNVAFPRQTGGLGASWMAENPGSDVSETNVTLDQVTLSPNTLMATTSITRQLLRQSSIDLDSLILNDLATAHALAVDKAAIHGAGTLEPLGIYGQSGVNAVAMGGAITFAKIVEMETAIASANADISTMAFLTTPEIRGRAKQVAQLANTIMLPIWDNDVMNGYRADVTNQVSKTMLTLAATGGSSHGIVFGVWSELMIGEWGTIELVVNPYSQARKGNIEYTSFQMVDVAVKHPKCFAVGTGLTNA